MARPDDADEHGDTRKLWNDIGIRRWTIGHRRTLLDLRLVSKKMLDDAHFYKKEFYV